MSLVETGDSWVEANFKETDLDPHGPGQPATCQHRRLSRPRVRPAKSPASAPAPARSSRCSRRRTPPATGSRSCSACRSASASTDAADGCRCAPASAPRSSVDTRRRRRRVGSAAGAAIAREAEPCLTHARPPMRPAVGGQASRPDHRLGDGGDDHADPRHDHRQRRAAAHAGEPRRGAGHDHLGAHLLHRRRGHRDADHRLARRQHRPQAPVPDLRRRLRRRVGALRHGVQPRARWWCSASCRAPSARRSRRCRSRCILDINPRERQGQAMAIWGAGIMVGADHRADARRAGSPTISTGAGCFYINLPVGIARARSACSLFMPDTVRRIRALRFLRLRACCRSPSARCSSCSTAAQQLDWFESTEILRRGGHRRRRGLDVRRPHRDRTASRSSTGACSRTATSSPRCVFIFVVGIMLLADHGAAAADAAEPLRLSGRHRRPGARAARHRHDGRR